MICPHLFYLPMKKMWLKRIQTTACSGSELRSETSACVQGFTFLNCCCSVAQSCSTLRPHELQHTRLPCPSLSPWVCLNSHQLSQWCHPTISSSVFPFSSCLQSFPASSSFGNLVSSHQEAKVLELQLQHQSFQWISRTDFLKDRLAWSPCSTKDSQELSPTPQFRSISSSAFILFLWSSSHIYTWPLEKP